MFVKLALFACFVAATLAAYNGPLAGGVPASLYPAGISPHACPNYPHCSNPSVAANPNAPAPYAAPAPTHYGQYNAAPTYHGGYDSQSILNAGGYTGDGDYRGEGLAEAGAYGDVSQNYNSAPAYNPAPVQHAGYNPQPAAIPAGVSPHSCPNYPFCH
ncbi:hypothetical protein FQR65_LT07808 [Abscondita terminalis]|nr:hypothetical protein FQR65_LT07808 [Abscondita terminalis]